MDFPKIKTNSPKESKEIFSKEKNEIDNKFLFWKFLFKNRKPRLVELFRKGDLELILKLQIQFEELIQILDVNGNMLITVAYHNGHRHLLNCFYAEVLSYSAETTSKYVATVSVLQWAILTFQPEETINELVGIENSNSLLEPHPIIGTPLELAASIGNLPAFKVLYKKFVDADKIVFSSQHVCIIKYLHEEMHFDISKFEKYFYLAARRGNLPLVKYLCEAGVNYNVGIEDYFKTALWVAIINKGVSVAKYLCQQPNILVYFPDCNYVTLAEEHSLSPLHTMLQALHEEQRCKFMFAELHSNLNSAIKEYKKGAQSRILSGYNINFKVPSINKITTYVEKPLALTESVRDKYLKSIKLIISEIEANEKEHRTQLFWQLGRSVLAEKLREALVTVPDQDIEDADVQDQELLQIQITRVIP